MMKAKTRNKFLACFLFVNTILGPPHSRAAIEPGFVDLKEVAPTVRVEMRYFSDWNFVGKVISGYQANRCILTKEAAHSLAQVQSYVESMGYSLLVFDCYRPQRAVDQFVRWTQDLNDQKMKKIFYPEEKKEKLIEQGYIASLSGHSRGSTLDLTLIKKDSRAEIKKLKYQEEAVDCRKQKKIESTGQLDMGTIFDCFSSLSNTLSPKVSKVQLSNRLTLKRAMEKFGFVNYASEWWHYTLRDEPFKDKYFDFVIESE